MLLVFVSHLLLGFFPSHAVGSRPSYNHVVVVSEVLLLAFVVPTVESCSHIVGV